MVAKRRLGCGHTTRLLLPVSISVTITTTKTPRTAAAEGWCVTLVVFLLSGVLHAVVQKWSLGRETNMHELLG